MAQIPEQDPLDSRNLFDYKAQSDGWEISIKFKIPFWLGDWFASKDKKDRRDKKAENNE